MSQVKVGRNEPCPCGSGKKFKKCCGRLEELLDIPTNPFIRYSQLMASAKIKLDKYYGDQIKRIRRDVQNRFIRFAVEKALPSEHETLFSDWLWFDKVDSEEQTLGYHYLRENGDFMDKSLQDVLMALNLSYLSVYEVETYNDKHLEVRDIFLDDKYTILLKEPWEIEPSEHKILLLGRLVKIIEENIFSGMVLMIDSKSEEKDFLKQHMDYLCKLNQEDLKHMLKFNGEYLYGIFDHAYRKNLVNMNNIQAVPAEKSEIETLLTYLKGDNEWTAVHKSEEMNWFKPTGENRGYIRIAVGADNIICCADVLEDILRLNDVLNSTIGKKEPIVLSNLFMSRPPAAEMAKLWFMVVKDQETERWLDTPHSELENKSPRELLNDNEGQTKLLDMLDEFAQSISTKEERELIDYMKQRVSNYFEFLK